MHVSRLIYSDLYVQEPSMQQVVTVGTEYQPWAINRSAVAPWSQKAGDIYRFSIFQALLKGSLVERNGHS